MSMSGGGGGEGGGGASRHRAVLDDASPSSSSSSSCWQQQPQQQQQQQQPYPLSRNKHKKQPQQQPSQQQQPLRSVLLNRLGGSSNSSSSRSSSAGRSTSRFLSPPSSPGGGTNNTTRGVGSSSSSSVFGGGSRNSSGGGGGANSVTFDLTTSPTIFIDDDDNDQVVVGDYYEDDIVHHLETVDDDPNVSSLFHTSSASPGRANTASFSSSSFSSLHPVGRHHHHHNRANSNNSSSSNNSFGSPHCTRARSSSPYSRAHRSPHPLSPTPPLPPSSAPYGTRTHHPDDGGALALQFVPATKKSMSTLLSPTDTTISTRCSGSHYSHNSSSSNTSSTGHHRIIPGSSWDHDLDDSAEQGEEKKESHHVVDYYYFPTRTTKSTSSNGVVSSSVASSLASRARQFRHARKQQQQPQQQQQRGSATGTTALVTACTSPSSSLYSSFSSQQGDDFSHPSAASISSSAAAAAAPQTPPPPPPRSRRLLLQHSYSDSSMKRQQQEQNDYNSPRGGSASYCPPVMSNNNDKIRNGAGAGWSSPSRSPIPHSASFSPSRSLSPLRRPHRLVSALSAAAFSPLHDGDDSRSRTSLDHHHHPAGNSSSNSSRNGAPAAGRMAWLFSSRAALPSRAGHAEEAELDEEKAITTVSINSPARSSGSSGYVGWPGTQDRRGATVALHSSYEDSDADVQTTSTTSEPHQQQQRRRQEEKLQAARSEVGRWTGASKASITSPAVVSSSRIKGGTTAAAVGSKNKAVSLQRDGPSVSSSAASSSSTPNHNSNIKALRSSLKSTLTYSPHDNSHRRVLSHELQQETSQTDCEATINIFKPSSSPRQQQQRQELNPLWSKMADEDLRSLSTPGTTYSKTSSAYFNEKDVRHLAYPDFEQSAPGPTTPSRPMAAASTSTTSQQQQPSSEGGGYSPYGVRLRNAEAAVAAVLRRPSNKNMLEPQQQRVVVPPTEESLAAKNHLSPPHRTFSVGSKGYVGLIDKTKEVPSLMDVDSDNSSRATSTHSCRPNNNNNINNNINNIADNESDVFDGLSLMNESDVFDNVGSPRRSLMPTSARKVNNMSNHLRSRTTAADYPDAIAEETALSEENCEGFNMVVLGGGLAAIQPSEYLFSNRQTAADYDDALTNSDVDQNGYHLTPGVDEMLNAGKNTDSSLLGIQGNIGRIRPQALFPEHEPESSLSRSESPQSHSDSELSSSNSSSLFSDPYDMSASHLQVHGNLGSYYVEPSVMKKVLRKYRKCAERQTHPDMSLADFERQEDENKTFALFEMRSRIMEKDIERGLERQGGTVVVDDLVMTSYNRTANRIRDAVIVSKGWRDGASPKDVINTALLTQRAERTYYIRRPIHSTKKNNKSHFGGGGGMRGSTSTVSGYRSPKQYSWEPVKWVDDTDFMMYRCASLGPRSLRGAEMFVSGETCSLSVVCTHFTTLY
jgi:hypothetical protein